MYGCESWTIKLSTEELMLLNCGVWEDSWEFLGLQGDQTSQSYLVWNLSWILIGRTDTETETQYLGHLMRRTDSLEKTLMLGKIEGRRRRGWQRMTWLYGIIDLMDMCLSKSVSWWWTGGLACYSPCGCKELDMTEQLNWRWKNTKLLCC